MVIFKQLYERLLKQKFLNRLLIAYTLIVIVIILFFSMTILENTNRALRVDATNSQVQAIQRAANYFEQKEATIKVLIQQLYLNPEQSQDMLEYLSKKIDTFDEEDFSQSSPIRYYLDSAAFQDEDIMDALIYKKNGQNLLVRSNYMSLNNDEYLSRNIGLYDAMDDHFYGLTLTPTYLQGYSSLPKKPIFTLSGNIRGGIGTTTFDRSIAILSVNFNTERIAGLFGQLIDRKFPMTLLVLDQEGRVVIDTSNRYYEGVYPYFEQVKESRPDARLDEVSMVQTIHSEKLGYYVTAVLPHAEIYDKSRSTRNLIVLIALLSIIFAIVLGVISIRFLARRIKFINKAIQKVQVGDFTYRIPIDETKDEISNIAVNFNQMCDWIVNYIEKGYLSELKQNEARLYALQSQIDPHFLYNTLEIIRMEALASGNEQVSHIIEILSQLFRNSIKGDRYVQIKDELRFCENYLELYNIRYADNLFVEYQIEADILEFGVMKHLLQPILENCIVHGLKPHVANNHITVKGYREADDIIIEIADNGKGMDGAELEKIKRALAASDIPDRQTIGIMNVHQRIRLAFGPAYGLSIDSASDQGTAVALRMPAKSKEELLADAESYHRG
ncbi:sensor histidine kinase [Cohnella sp. GCM10012308]|uniref:sensor histidine kinase n=1 Tax=Cohnella sp. GCM10012308 TaxID=3317329 RepID=UPI003605F358